MVSPELCFSLRELSTCQPIQAYPRLRGLDCQVAMDIGGDTHHKLSAEVPVSQGLRKRLLTLLHVRDGIRYDGTDSPKRCFGGRRQPA